MKADRAMNCCPQCGSDRLYRDGLRYLSSGKTVQRYYCCSCGYRFSEPSVKGNVTGKIGKAFDSRENHHKKRVVTRNRSVKEASNNLPFLPSENIASHTASNLTIIEKGLTTLFISCIVVFVLIKF